MEFKIEFTAYINDFEAFEKSTISSDFVAFCQSVHCKNQGYTKAVKNEYADVDFDYSLDSPELQLLLCAHRTLSCNSEYHYYAQMFEAFFQLLSLQDILYSTTGRLVDS